MAGVGKTRTQIKEELRGEVKYILDKQIRTLSVIIYLEVVVVDSLLHNSF